MQDPSGALDLAYRLEDRLERETGRLYLTGWDAIVRLPLMQRRRDAAAGLNTAGFVSGYPGSPLGGVDSLFRQHRARLAAQHVHFEPGTNEDLAATSIWGTQYLNVGPVSSRYDGVFGLWYGKGPGVDRSTDAIRTAQFQGVAATGGVLALAGDDHDARSTVTAQQSETLFVHIGMPVLNPATIQDYLDYGLAGWALSRFSRCWVGMICLNDTADSAASVDVDARRPRLVVPDFPEPPSLAMWRSPAELEVDIHDRRLPAARAFVRANGLDVVTLRSDRRRLGIVAAGKAHLDVQDALAGLGLTDARAAELGITVYKPAMTWPLEPEGLLEFASGLEELLVVEPKHPIIEDQAQRLLRRLPTDRRPELVGKTDERGAPLVPVTGALDATIVRNILLSRLERVTGDAALVASLRPRQSLVLADLGAREEGTSLVRAPGFCSGCPHNTGTLVPEGSFNIGGTGCHGMATMQSAPGRETHMFTHMGGEGALWIGMAPFAERTHTFQNMGDGTYFHSGSLAIRAAIAAGVNITFKVLLNGYISMTGGQAIPGGLSAQAVARQVLAEGARRVVVVSDDPTSYPHGERFPDGVDVRPREDLLSTQEKLREVPGVTVLVYDQACAAELRRERKRGRAVDPDKRVFIHEGVCEGCGDCNVQSNCISVEPLETELGRKRTIDQSSCNKDFSCLNGYCPSFVTLYGATPRARSAVDAGDRLGDLPPPARADAAEPYNVLIGGIGGSGVLTIGALLGMAAHLEGRSVSVLNESGMAQKNGSVQSHVRILDQPGVQLSPRIAAAGTDLVIGADVVVVSSDGPIMRMAPGRTRAIVSDDVRPTVAFSADRDLDLSNGRMARRLRRATGDQLELVEARRVALAAMGDAIYTNLLLLGFAAQRGLLPVGIAALERAVELNGVSVDANKRALAWGRLLAHDADAVERAIGAPAAAPTPQSVDELIADRAARLVAYQDRAYADRYLAVVRRVAEAEHARTPGHEELVDAVARNLFTLMAYKDEYEVARLYTEPGFRARLEREFEGDYRMKINLAPQLFNRRDPRTGRARKWEIPATAAMPAFRLLARGKRLRGTRLDVFGRTAHRTAERARIGRYEALVEELIERLGPGTHAIAVQLAALPGEIRGFDTVKDAAAAAADEKQAILLAELRAARPAPVA